MRIDLGPDQIASYDANGFLVLEGVLDANELQRWRDVVARAMDTQLTDPRGRHNQHEKMDQQYAQVFTQCNRLSDVSPEIAGLVRDPRLGELAGRLVGADAMRIWHDQALVKQPHSNATSWHNDDPYWSFSSYSSVNMWVPLDDATLANGCLWYLPGTHKTATYDLVRIGPNMGDLLEQHPEWKKLDGVPTPCPAGSIVIHNGLVTHGAGPNLTSRARRVMTSTYFPDGEVYNGKPDTLPKEYYETLKEGDPLDDDRYVPLVWRR